MDCFPVYQKVLLYQGDVIKKEGIKKATRIDLGEPDTRYFDLAPELREQKPSKAYIEEGRRVGKTAFAPAQLAEEFAAKDAVYEEHNAGY